MRRRSTVAPNYRFAAPRRCSLPTSISALIPARAFRSTRIAITRRAGCFVSPASACPPRMAVTGAAHTSQSRKQLSALSTRAIAGAHTTHRSTLDRTARMKRRRSTTATKHVGTLMLTSARATLPVDMRRLACEAGGSESGHLPLPVHFVVAQSLLCRCPRGFC